MMMHDRAVSYAFACGGEGGTKDWVGGSLLAARMEECMPGWLVARQQKKKTAGCAGPAKPSQASPVPQQTSTRSEPASPASDLVLVWPRQTSTRSVLQTYEYACETLAVRKVFWPFHMRNACVS